MNPFKYWREFFEDFKIWRRFRKAAKQSEALLTKNDMRVDWLGRIYTVINMPEEVINNQEQVQQGWVISQLGPMNDVLMKIGISDYAYPEISMIPGSSSYLVVMYPEIDALNPWRILGNSVVLAIIYVLGYIAVNVAKYYGIVELLDKIKGIGNV